MTVSELIQLLRSCPGNMRVVTHGPYSGAADVDRAIPVYLQAGVLHTSHEGPHAISVEPAEGFTEVVIYVGSNIRIIGG